jgi:hypothetical protein
MKTATVTAELLLAVARGLSRGGRRRVRISQLAATLNLPATTVSAMVHDLEADGRWDIPRYSSAPGLARAAAMAAKGPVLEPAEVPAATAREREGRRVQALAGPTRRRRQLLDLARAAELSERLVGREVASLEVAGLWDVPRPAQGDGGLRRTAGRAVDTDAVAARAEAERRRALGLDDPERPARWEPPDREMPTVPGLVLPAEPRPVPVAKTLAQVCAELLREWPKVKRRTRWRRSPTRSRS